MEAHSVYGQVRASVAELCFSYAIVLALFVNFFWAEGHDQQRCIELAILIPTLGIALVRGLAASALQAIPAPARWYSLAFLALGACSLTRAYSPGHVINEWSMFVMLGIAASIVAHEFANASDAGRQRMLLVLASVCGLYALRELLVYAAHLAVKSPLSYLEIAIGFSNFRFLNHTQTALLPLLALLAVQAPGVARARRIACFAVSAFWWSILFFVEARATVLGLLVACAMVLAVRRQHALPYLKTMVMAAVCGACIYLVLFIAVPMLAGMPPFGVPDRILERTVSDPASGRQFLWKRAIELIAQHPVLGVGPQHFAHAGADLGWGAHPHDWVLQIATEWGIPALCCVIAMLMLGIRGLLRAAAAVDVDDTRNQAVCTALIVAVTAIVVDGLFSGVLVMPQSQLAILLVFGMAIGWVRSRQAVSAPRARGAVRFTSLILVLTALGAMVVTAGPDFMRKWNAAPLTEQELVRNRFPTHWPRFWGSGYF